MRLVNPLTALAARLGLSGRTIRLRLTAVYGSLFLLCGVGLLAITYAFVQHATAGYYTANGPDGITIGFASHSPHGGAHSREHPGFQASSRQGRNNAGLPPAQARALGRQLQELAISQHAHEMHWLLIYSGLALGIMAVLSAGLGWLVAGRVLRPMRTITTTARKISANSLHQRLALAGPDDELKELGDTIDDLLGRLDAAFRSQRQFVANASHELRTPLALQRTLVQLALADPDADAASLRAAHERVLASGAQQERIVEALLTLSRGQAGLRSRERFDLATLAGHVLLSRDTEARDRRLTLQQALAPAPAAGDPHLTERLIANLVDNALRHNSPGGHVEVATGMHGAHSVLSVINTGPEVPAREVDRLLQPFQRLETERTRHGDGLGLGLSIVHAIAQAHGADLAIRPQPAGGLQAEVSFPVPGGHGQPAAPTPAQRGDDNTVGDASGRVDPAEPVDHIRPLSGASGRAGVMSV